MTGTALTATDRRIIAKAGEVAALKDAAAQRDRYGDTDSEMARAAALGEAQFLLLEQNAIIKRLTAIIDRLTGGDERPTVHYRYPAVCGKPLPDRGELWSGNLDRVTCSACRDASEQESVDGTA